MTNRPILVTLAYWGLVAIIQLGLMISCGFSPGHDEASNYAFIDCRYDAGVKMEAVNFVSILIYAIWAVITIKRLNRGRDPE